MFLHYDPVMRQLTGTETASDTEEHRATLTEQGVSFIVIEGGLPGVFDWLGVNFDGELEPLKMLPDCCCPEDIESDVQTSVPALDDLPEGGVIEPAAGTAIGSGETYVTVRAPLYRPHQFAIRVHTAQDRRDVLLAHAAARRDALIDAGIMFRDRLVASDDTCASRVLRKLEAARRNPDWSEDWHCADGSTLRLTAADLGDLHDAIEANTVRAFTRYAATKAAIEAGAITTEEDADAAMAAGA